MTVPYFFLSYARSAPGASETRPAADHWAMRFYTDLCHEVAQRAGLTDPGAAGFIDQDLAVGENWKDACDRAIRAAHVLVALYAPEYFGKNQPHVEQQLFRRRVHLSGASAPGKHIVPVLWAPFEPWEARQESAEAEKFGIDTPGYTADGMRLMCMRNGTSAGYTRIVQRAAARIVECVRTDPLGLTPDIERPAASVTDAQFIVGIVALDGLEWRPWPHHPPLAEQTENFIESLGPSTVAAPAGDVGDLLAERPSILLADPRIIGQPGGLDSLAVVASRLPGWCPALIVAASNADPQAARTAQCLIDVGVRTVTTVSQLKELDAMLAHLVKLVKRHYMEQRPVQHAPGPPFRRSLRRMDASPDTQRKWSDE